MLSHTKYLERNRIMNNKMSTSPNIIKFRNYFIKTFISLTIVLLMKSGYQSQLTY